MRHWAMPPDIISKILTFFALKGNTATDSLCRSLFCNYFSIQSMVPALGSCPAFGAL